MFVDDTLVLHAVFPIPDLVPARYRPPILIVDGRRFVLVSMRAADPRAKGAAQGAAQGRTIYTLRLERPNLYEPGGREIGYDGERHLERRRERQRTALAWLLWIPTVPLLPVLGLLPEQAKQKLVHLGVDPSRATRLSLTFEWLLLALLLIVYPFTGGFFTGPGLVVGVLAFFVMTDIAYRVSADFDGRAPGAFVGLVDEIATWLRDLRAPPLLPDAQEPTPTERAAPAPPAAPRLSDPDSPGGPGGPVQ